MLTVVADAPELAREAPSTNPNSQKDNESKDAIAGVRVNGAPRARGASAYRRRQYPDNNRRPARARGQRRHDDRIGDTGAAPSAREGPASVWSFVAEASTGAPRARGAAELARRWGATNVRRPARAGGGAGVDPVRRRGVGDHRAAAPMPARRIVDADPVLNVAPSVADF